MDDTRGGISGSMEGFPRFCQLAIITANIIALIKSVEMTFFGASLFVLDPALTFLLAAIDVTSNDFQTEVKGAHVMRLVAMFMLIVGPLIFLVGVTGLTGAYRKSTGWLVCYLALLIILITTVVTLCALGLPRPLMDPSSQWRPLSDFMLTTVVLSLATQGIMIFFTVALMSALAKDEGQVHPSNDAAKNSKLPRTGRPSRR